jgi:O-methyltransferase
VGHDHDMEPTQQLRTMVNAYQVSQALHVAATFGISDLLAAGPRGVTDLALATGTHAPTLVRLMRALEAAGVYASDPDGRYANTELGEQLRSDAPGSLGGWTAFIGRPNHWQAWAGLADSVRTGDSAFEAQQGMSVWEYRKQHPEEQVIFDAAMTAMSGSIADGVVEHYDFRRFETIVDVGGGAGKLLAAILQRYPDLRGVLFDQPDVVAGAGPILADAGVSDRCETVGGSFFESLPTGADAYLMKAVIHDWADAESIDILRTCRRAMPDSGALLLVEQLIGQGPDPVRTAFSDLNMLVGPGGQERTLEEYGALFAASGFELTGATETGTFVFVIEAVPTT